MLHRLRTIQDDLRTSLWLIPSVMVVTGIALAAVMLHVDASNGPDDQRRVWWLNSGDGEDVRNLLSTLLSAIITMASMAFSVTVVALTLAANMYGPRLIRIFRADPRTQFVLGVFAMTIVYCLLVLRSVHGQDPVSEVPHFSVTIGTLLSLVSVLALLAFIQGVARSIAADAVVQRVRGEADRAVVSLSPIEVSAVAGGPGAHASPESAELHAQFAQETARIALPSEGYVQAVDYDRLVAWAERHDAVLKLEFRAGDFVVDGDRRVRMSPPPADPERVRAELGRAIVSGDERTPTQDVEFAIRHLVEVAVRALSPGVNDPFTAKAVIDRLRGALSRLMGRRFPSEALRDRAGRLRVWRQVASYDGVLDAAFHQIRQAGSQHPAVLIHLLKAIASIAEHARLDEQRRALARHARLVRAAGRRDVTEPADDEDIDRSFQSAMVSCRLVPPPEAGEAALADETRALRGRGV